MQKSTHLVFKIIVIGESGVGKSAMFLRYIKGEFSKRYDVTVGVQFGTKSTIVANNVTVNLQIWDTSGQQIYRPLMKSFYKGISAVFLVYQIDKQATLNALKAWHQQARQHCHEQVMFFLVGNKADLKQKRVVTQQHAQQMMRTLGAVFYIQTSAVQNQNIQQVHQPQRQLFQKAADIMYKNYASNKSFREISNVQKVNKNNNNALDSSVTTDAIFSQYQPGQNQNKYCCQIM